MRPGEATYRLGRERALRELQQALEAPECTRAAAQMLVQQMLEHGPSYIDMDLDLLRGYVAVAPLPGQLVVEDVRDEEGRL